MPNTGEITEDYPTYIKHMLMAFGAGALTMFILVLTWMYTKIFQTTGAVLWKFCLANPLVPLLSVGFTILVTAVYFKTRGGGDKKYVK